MGRKSRQEQALIALLEQPSIRAAAEVSGVSQPTIFRYLQDPDFRKAYQQAKKALLDAALGDLQKASSEAVSTLREVMLDREITPGVRVAAARAILAFSIQVGQLEEVLRRLEAVEDYLRK